MERTCTAVISFLKQLCVQQHSVVRLANFYFPILQTSDRLNCQKKLFTPVDDSETKAVLCPPELLVSSKWVPSTWQKHWFAGRSLNTAGETGILLILKKKKKKVQALLMLRLRKKVTVGADREQTVCPNTSAALKEKKTRSWKSTQPVSDMANDNYSSCFKVGHLGSRSLPPSRELFLWSFGGLSQLPGQQEDVRLTGPQYLSPGTVNECASSAAALPAQAWGGKRAVTHLLLFGDQRPLSWELDPPLAGVPLVFAVGGDSGEEGMGGIGVKKLKIICNPPPKKTKETSFI